MNANLMNYSDAELLNYLYWYSDDPIVKRLVEMGFKFIEVQRKLENADIDLDLEHDGRHILDHLESKENEISYLNSRVHELEDEVERLGTRSVIDFISSVHTTLSNYEHEIRSSYEKINDANARADDLQKKLSMWAKLNGQVENRYY